MKLLKLIFFFFRTIPEITSSNRNYMSGPHNSYHHIRVTRFVREDMKKNANQIYKEGLRYSVYNRKIFAPFILHLTQIMLMK